MADVLERGEIYFLYRPKVERREGEVGSIADVQRLYMVLHPRDQPVYRLVVVGQKHLPEAGDGGQRTWGFVEKVARRPEDLAEELGQRTYATKTRGERVQPATRPAGEGVYVIVAHGERGSRHTHLAYALELPEKPGEVQEELRIPEEASYILSVKNPEAPAPRGVGLGPARRAELPERLEAVFRGRRFADADPPELLNHEGVEILLVGADEDPSELGIDLDAEEEKAGAVDVFTDLRLDRAEHPAKPLFRGEWA